MSQKELDLDFVYPDSEICIQPDVQHAKLKCCGVAPEVFGEYVDITHYAMETIMAAKRGGASINGSVHVSQFFEQRSPVECRHGGVVAHDGGLSSPDVLGR